MSAIGYIRQSRRADLDLALSYDSQLAAIQRLAERDGVEATIHADMGRSGGAGKEHLRPGYQAVMAAISTGSVDTVYALSLTRLARSTAELYRIMSLAQEHKVRLVFAKEGVMDPASPLGKAQFGMMAVFAEFERDLAVERARDNVAVRRARGERMGRIPYGERPGDQPQAVVDAWLETRSYNGAARLLNDAGMTTWLGRPWVGPSVREVLLRERPDLVSRLPAKRGVKPASPFLFYQLLRCSCGRTLTASHDPRRGDATTYRCQLATAMPDHPRPYRVSEDAVRPWVEAEAAKYRPPVDAVELAAADEEERGRLEARRVRILDMYQDGLIDKPERDRRMGVITEGMAALDGRRIVAEVPTLDWSAPPEFVNVVLRAMFHYVQMGPDMRPLRAEWAV